ncbi:MAG: VOC family protein [Pseudomonadota bacterium]
MVDRRLGCGANGKGIRYYSKLFGATPTREKDGYAQWLLDDPSLNFVIEESARHQGLNHLGLQAQSEDELGTIFQRFDATGGPVSNRGKTQCCYAVSDKGWARDPAGIAWEGFFTHHEAKDYGHAGDFTPRPENIHRQSEKSGKDTCC